MNFFNYFKIKELVSNCSQFEIYNCINNNHFDNLLVLGGVLDELREYLQQPIVVTSSYRSVVHNKHVGGSPTSQHLYGAAIDFKVSKIPFQSLVCQVKSFLADHGYARSLLGQVIFYYDKEFIHIALKCSAHNYLQYYDKGKCKDNH